MTLDEINSIDNKDKEFLHKVDTLIRFRNRKCIFIMKNYFSKLRLEFQVYTNYTLTPNLPVSAYRREDQSTTINKAIADYHNNDDCDDINKNAAALANDEYIYFVIRYPEITVTNENNESVNIRNLYALASIENNIVVHLEALVSSYTYNMAASGYAFSHIHSVNFNDINPVRFNSCCLGDGPIVTLKSKMIEERSKTGAVRDHRITMMCMNIDRYFHVESISGGPYIRMSTIGSDTNGYELINLNGNLDYYSRNFCDSDIFRYIVKDCLIRMSNDGKYFLDFNTDFRKNGESYLSVYGFKSYACVKDPYKFCIEFSKYFKNVYAEYSLLYDLPDTETLKRDCVLSEYYEINDKLYKRVSHITQNFDNVNGMFLFDFNGKPVNIEIEEMKKDGDNARNRLYVTLPLCKKIHRYYRDMLTCSRTKNNIIIV